MIAGCVDEQRLPELRGRSLADAAGLADELADADPDDFRAWEAPIAAAIWTCVQPSHDEAVARLPGVVATFEEEHADDIAAAEKVWAERRKEAAGLGWSSSAPRAGFQG